MPPVLGLPPSAPAEEYLDRRAELGPAEATRLLLRATGVGCFLFDTGYVLDEMLGLPEMAAAAGARAESGDWSAADAIRVAGMIGSGNARRVYRLG